MGLSMRALFGATRGIGSLPRAAAAVLPRTPGGTIREEDLANEDLGATTGVMGGLLGPMLARARAKAAAIGTSPTSTNKKPLGVIGNVRARLGLAAPRAPKPDGGGGY